MLYWIAEHLGFTGLLNLIRYQSFRTGAAVATALLIGLIIGPRFIGWLRVRQGKGQPIRADGPQTHLAKRGTPTMGGLMILTSHGARDPDLDGPVSNPYVWACLFVTLGFGAIGFLDDYDKVRKASTAGVSGSAPGCCSNSPSPASPRGSSCGRTARTCTCRSPTGMYLDLGYAFPLFAAFTIVAFGNAVNLTDGLDGLATMPVIIASVAFMLIVYLAGNVKFATYLGIPHVPGAGELAIFCGAVVGAGLAFLWFNAPPAAVFMGDTGSLALGGALGTIAVVAHHEIVLGIVGGLFVVGGAVGHHPGVLLQAHRQARVPHGADPPPFRAAGLERADRRHPLLDHQPGAGACRPVHAEAAVRTMPVAPNTPSPRTWSGVHRATWGRCAPLAIPLAEKWTPDQVRGDGSIWANAA